MRQRHAAPASDAGTAMTAGRPAHQHRGPPEGMPQVTSGYLIKALKRIHGSL